MACKKIKKVFMLAFVLIFILQGTNVFAQSNSFPRGSTQGTTEMNLFFKIFDCTGLYKASPVLTAGSSNFCP